MAFIVQCCSNFRRTSKKAQVIVFKNCIFEILKEGKTLFYSVANNSHSQIEHSDWLIIIFLLRFLSIDWNPSSWLFLLNYITPCPKLLSKFTCSGLYKEMLTLVQVIVRKKLSFILVPDEPFPHLVPYVIPTLLEFLDGLKTQVNNFNFTSNIIKQILTLKADVSASS